MLRKPLAALVLAAAALAVAAPALAGNGGFAPVPPESPNAERITTTYWVILAFTGAIFVLVEGCLIYFIVRYRRRARPIDAEGPQLHGHNRLELAWTVAPAVILAIIAGVVFYELPGIQDVPSASAAGPRLEVRVEGRQFYWNFRYPNGVIAVDRLRVPVNRVVRLEVTAPTYDVIHSWWVPALGGKIDAIPGKVNETWFQVDKPGLYRGQCAELCGIQHAAMLNSVEVLPQGEFDGWLAEQEREQRSPRGDTALGRATYREVCAKCHGFRREGLIGPALTEATVSNTDALKQILDDGRGAMPPVGRDWDPAQVDALIAHLQAGSQGGG